MKSRWIEHRGKRVFLADWAGFGYDVDALEAEVEEMNALTFAQPRNSMLVVIDFRGTAGCTGAMSLFKMNAVETKACTRRAAVVGVTGYRRPLLDAVSLFSGRAFGSFSDLDKAKDWVVEVD